MINQSILVILIASLLGISPAASEEVLVHGGRLSVHVKKAPLARVLQNLSRQGVFSITVIEKDALNGVTLTDQFDSLPMEEGLARLLNRWNFGFTKSRSTGKIQEVVIVSQRIYPDNSPKTTQFSTQAHNREPSSDRPRYSVESGSMFQDEKNDQDRLEKSEGWEGDKPSTEGDVDFEDFSSFDSSDKI